MLIPGGKSWVVALTIVVVVAFPTLIAGCAVNSDTAGRAKFGLTIPASQAVAAAPAATAAPAVVDCDTFRIAIYPTCREGR